MFRSSAASDLDVVVVPYLHGIAVDHGIGSLEPYLRAAERAAETRAVVMLPGRERYGGLADALVKDRETITERSRQFRGGGPVVAYLPSVDGIQFAQRLSGGWLGVIAWSSGWLDGWARYVDAIDARTGEKYPELSLEARDAIDEIDWSGNNGWPGRKDQFMVHQVRQGVIHARSVGLSDVEIYGSMVALGHDQKSIVRLMRLIRDL